MTSEKSAAAKLQIGHVLTFLQCFDASKIFGDWWRCSLTWTKSCNAAFRKIGVFFEKSNPVGFLGILSFSFFSSA